MIVVVDYGMNNVRSIVHKIERLKHEARVGSTPDDIRAADKLILPGVGHFAAGMENLKKRGFLEPLNEKVISQKTPVLGICLGMQLLAKHSEEGDSTGLGWLDADVKHFNFNGQEDPLPIPHVAWNTLHVKRDNPLISQLPEDHRFYFVHSYHMHCESDDDTVCTTRYGYDFISVVQRDNIWGTQFHPEKSHHFGLQLLENFLNEA